MGAVGTVEVEMDSVETEAGLAGAVTAEAGLAAAVTEEGGSVEAAAEVAMVAQAAHMRSNTWMRSPHQ